MKALLLTKSGSYKKMKYGEIKKPTVKAGYVRVKVEAAGLNPVDYKIAQRGHPSFKYPVILGFDVAGVVEAISSGEKEWKKGDKVYFHTGVANTGGFAQYVLADSRSISKLPDGLSYIEAAAIPCAGFTAYQALVKRMKVNPGKTILILGGSGGVGSFAVQIAAAMGLHVIATCSDENIEFLKTLGATDVIDYKSKNITSEVKRITSGRLADYILDTVSSQSALANLDSLCYAGTMACIAGLPDLNKTDRLAGGFTIINIMLGSAHFANRPEAIAELKEIGDEIGQMVANGAVHPVIDSVIGFDEILEGLESLEGRHVRGKIVASIGETSEQERQSDLRWASESIDPATIRIPPDSSEYPHPDFFWNSFHWSDLSERERELWKALGWSAKSWRGDKEPPDSFNKGWKYLSQPEREAAKELSYSKSTWNSKKQ